MTDVWNPYDKIGVMPFQQFNTWKDFMEHYVVPKNVILRGRGPGDEIQAGEWYLTPTPESVQIEEGYNKLYLSYVGPDGFSIRIIEVPSNTDKTINDSFSTHRWNSWKGTKDGWGKDWDIHYKVDIEDVVNFDFLNWRNGNLWGVKG